MTTLNLLFEENYRYATVRVMNNCHLKLIYEEHENVVKNRQQDNNDFKKNIVKLVIRKRQDI